MSRSYRDLKAYQTFQERFEYLRLRGAVGERTFGSDRYYNQQFYRSREWKLIRDQVIIRDNGCDLGIPGYEIHDRILIHHMNPMTMQDLVSNVDDLLDPEYLVSVSHRTHNAIHYGDETLLDHEPVVRTPGDTLLWKR